MQPDILTLIVINMYGDFRGIVQFHFFGQVGIFQGGSNDIVRCARGHAQRKFAVVIGVELPVMFFVVFIADVDSHSVDRLPCRRPNSSKDEGVGLIFSVGSLGGSNISAGQEKENNRRQIEKR